MKRSGKCLPVFYRAKGHRNRIGDTFTVHKENCPDSESVATIVAIDLVHILFPGRQEERNKSAFNACADAGTVEFRLDGTTAYVYWSEFGRPIALTDFARLANVTQKVLRDVAFAPK